MVAGSVESQYLVGSTSSFGHSMSNHSRARGSESFWSRCAARTRSAACRSPGALRKILYVIVVEVLAGDERLESVKDFSVEKVIAEADRSSLPLGIG